jgi:hypothetical protein
MDVTITISYTTDNQYVNRDIAIALDSILPYMVDNVDVHFETEE